jgi:lipoprotein-anchoring transpeptidase ErfK/SrfK
MSQGRNRGPLSSAVSRKVTVDPRFSGARRLPRASVPQSRRTALCRLGGGFATLVLALGASSQTVFAQEQSDPGPGRWQTGDKEVVVSLGAERLWAYEGEDDVLTTLVSTGTAQTPELTTPIGHWSILAKFPMETMTGTIDGQPYEVDDVPYVMYFTNEGHALHGTYWHNNFGTPMSHGCVNLPMDVAEWMYGWAPEGTAVTIIP